MEEKVKFVNSKNERLSGYIHSPKEKTEKGVVLTHCFTCSKHQKIIRTVCHALAEEGYLALRFDFSGNGESEGKFEDSNYTKQILDLQDAIAYLRKKAIKKIGLVGHSMGSAVAILTTQKEWIDSLCTISGSSYAESLKEIFSEDTIREVEKKGKTKAMIFGREITINNEFIEDTKRHNIGEALKNYKNPYCIIHGSKDNIIKPENAKKLYEYSKSQKKEMYIIDGADHIFSKENDIEKLQQLVAGWFKKTL